MVKPRSLSGARAPTNLMPMGETLKWHARRNPDAPAVTLGDETITREQLDRRSDDYAVALRELGVGHDDVVTVCLPSGPEHHLVTFALWKLGATPSPVSHRLPPEELEAVVQVSGARLVVAMEGLAVGAAPVVRPEALRGARATAPVLTERVGTYLKANTSGGSTGRPKVIVSHQPPLLDPEAPWLGMEVDDVSLHPAPLYHNAPFMHTNMALSFGGHAIEMARFDPREWLALVERFKVRWSYLVPTMMSRIWALPQEVRESYDVSSLEFVVHMASMCPVWLKEKWIGWLGADVLWDVYGGTEGIGVTAISGPEWLERPGSVGKLWVGKDLRILGEDGSVLPPGEIGEVRFVPPDGPPPYHYLGGQSNSDGETDSYGDLGWLDEEGYLYLADRRTDMVIVGGVNVYPAEVEAVLDSHPKIASSLVIGLPDDDLGARLHAIVQPEDPRDPPELAELRAFLDRKLVSYKRPRSVEFVADPLRDDAGKARRRAFQEDRAARLRAGERFLDLASQPRQAMAD